MSQSLQHQLHTNIDDQASIGRPTTRNIQHIPYRTGEGEESTIYPKSRNLRRRSGVIADPNALINRPKSAYTRNRRTNDEEPVFWQHSDRATKRFHHSQFTTPLPTSPPIRRQPTGSRRSNASNFETLLDQTFARQPALNLQPNPVINVEPPSTPSLPPTPIEDVQSPEETNLSSPQISSFSSPQESPNQQRFSGFRPLQLDFYLPGNRLSLLPRFSDDHDVDHDIRRVPGITRPPSALMKAKPSPIFDCPLTSFSIPRKAVASQAASTVNKSKCFGVQSSATLNGGTYSRGSLLHDHLRSDRRISRSTLRNTQDFQKSADKPLPSSSRPASTTWTDIAERLSSHRVSAQSAQFETNFDERTQVEFEYPTVSEKCSPISLVSPASSKRHSAVEYHDYEFVGEACQVPEQLSAVEYHDYEFIGEARQVPELSEVPPQHVSLQVARLFHAPTSSNDSSDDELPPPSKPRSSSGSSTLYHGESSLDSNLPAIKTTLSVAFPSPSLQHRLSDWLSRSASQIQAFSPQRGECYGHTDSPTLGFSWKDFGWNTEKRTSNSEGGSHRGRRSAYTDGSSASTYVDGSDDVDLEKFPVPVSMARNIGVGVAF